VPNLHENFLKKILCVVRHPEHAHRKGIHQRRELIVKLAECLTILIRRLPDKIGG
jgi:hypothetical protein